VRAGPTCRLERNDDVPASSLLTAPGLVLHGDARPAATSRHAQPAWKLVVALEGELRLRSADGSLRATPAVLVPPGVPHSLASTAASRCLLVEPWLDRFFAVGAPVLLGAGPAGRLAGALDEPAAADLPAVAEHVGEVLRSVLPLDALPPAAARVRAAAARAALAGSLGELATEVGLSGGRLRELVRADLGVRLSEVRLWQRLTACATATGEGLAQRAAEAGFSDQAHLARTSRRLVGRTPTAVLGRPATGGWRGRSAG
jgi:AraC-like DNA-binding protein